VDRSLTLIEMTDPSGQDVTDRMNGGEKLHRDPLLKATGIVAITVTHNPRLEDGRLAKQLAQLRNAGVFHIVVDNASRNVDSIRGLASSVGGSLGNLAVVALPENSGIGTAINRGVKAILEKREVDWFLLLDQDTYFAEGAFELFLKEVADVPDSSRIAIFGFNYVLHRFNRLRPHNNSNRPKVKGHMITSGSLVRAQVIKTIPVDEGLFLYFVDVDYAYRVRKQGWKICVARHAFIDHMEGLVTVSRTGRPRYFVPPERLFYMARNSLTVSQRYLTVRPLSIPPYQLLMNLAARAEPIRSANFALKGIVAFIRGRREGPYSSA